MATQPQPQPQAQAKPQGQSLRSFIKNNRRFVKIKDGESFRCFYQGFKVTRAMSFGEEKEVVVYMVQEDGVDHPIGWQTTSVKVAEDMEKFSPGTEIIITRKGSTSNDTKYDIKAA